MPFGATAAAEKPGQAQGIVYQKLKDYFKKKVTKFAVVCI